MFPFREMVRVFSDFIAGWGRTFYREGTQYKFQFYNVRGVLKSVIGGFKLEMEIFSTMVEREFEEYVPLEEGTSSASSGSNGEQRKMKVVQQFKTKMNVNSFEELVLVGNQPFRFPLGFEGNGNPYVDISAWEEIGEGGLTKLEMYKKGFVEACGKYDRKGYPLWKKSKICKYRALFIMLYFFPKLMDDEYDVRLDAIYKVWNVMKSSFPDRRLVMNVIVREGIKKRVTVSLKKGCLVETLTNEMRNCTFKCQLGRISEPSSK